MMAQPSNGGRPHCQGLGMLSGEGAQAPCSWAGVQSFPQIHLLSDLGASFHCAVPQFLHPASSRGC